jgi:hypothetical protein
MDRAQVLALIDVANARGLEIGALNRPVVTREMGPVEYVDRASRAELQAWYAMNDEVDVDRIVEVDHIWGEQTLLEAVGGERAYQYLVASHVIEHVPDLFGWLGEIAAVLADGGVACFFAPDKRYTFDVLRRTSSESELVDAYVRGLRRPDARQIFDHFNGFRDLGSEEIRNGAAPGDVASIHPPRELLELCRKVQSGGEYIDTHCWVFTPRTMAEALDLASRLDVLPFEIAALESTAPGVNEFFVGLRRLPDGLTPEDRRAAFLASAAGLDLPPEDEAASRIQALERRAQAAEQRVAAIEASTSWRLTAPLRAVVTRLRSGRS